MLLNFREISQMPADSGRRIRPGLLFRGGAVLEAEAAELIMSRGISVVCDLRNSAEATRFPSALRTAGLLHASDAHDIDIAAPLQLTRDSLSTAEDNHAAMVRVYRYLPEIFAPVFRTSFAALTKAEGGVFVHCAIGKDRTGVTVALLLSLLGVPRDSVMQDYLVTNAAFDDIAASMAARHGTARSWTDPALRPVMVAHEDYLDAFLTAIGDPVEYYRNHLGFDEAEIARLRNRYLA